MAGQFANYSGYIGGGGGGSSLITSVSDTNSINLTVLAGNLTADLLLSSNAADAGFLIVANDIESTGVIGLRSQVSISGIRALISATAPLTYNNTTGVLAITLADATHDGYLSSTDWNTFNNKQNTLTLGNLTDVGTDGITITGGTGAVVGAGTSISQHVADTTHNGYLSSTDWNTFNGKQAAGNYITALTGDGTATGPGSVAFTLATVNGNVGTFGSSTAIPTFTVNAKGLITAASTNVVIAPAGTLTGTTLASNVVSSSLTSVGTITTGVWNGTTIDIAHGGTNSTTALNNNRVMVSSGGAIVETAAITANRALKSNASGLPVASTATATDLDNLSGTNTGNVTLTAVGATPNANAATITGQVLNLEYFNSTNPGVVPLSGGGTTNFLRADGTWAAPSGGGGATAANVYLKDVKSSGVNAQALSSGAWNVRNLNTTENPQSWLSLVSDEFTLDVGTYIIDWSAPGFQVNNHQTRIFDVTNAVTLVPGTSELAPSGIQSRSFGIFQWDVTGAPTTYRLEQHPATTASGGNAVAAGEPEVYSMVQITKLA